MASPTKGRDPKRSRQYQRRYKTLKVRSPKSILRHVTATAEGVSFHVFSRSHGWIPVEFRYASGMAADLAVLTAALDSWDVLAVQKREGSQ